MRAYRLCNRPELSGDSRGCQLHPAAGGDCNQQKWLNSLHVESDARGEERDEPAAAYHDNVDVDHHDNSYDYHDTVDKYDLHQHVNNNNNDCDDHNDADDDNIDRHGEIRAELGVRNARHDELGPPVRG